MRIQLKLRFGHVQLLLPNAFGLILTLIGAMLSTD